MAGVDLGRVAYVPKGAYDPEMIYNRLDVVSYQGSSYVSRIDGNTGNTPEVGVNWASVASKGDKGDKGDKGATGAQGVKGDTGAIGPQGPKGDTGPVGPQGVIGDTGAVGPQGPKGDTGAKGDKGDKGDTGATGATGPQGLKGDKGDQGIQGIQGVKGDKGDPGQNGVISVDAPSDGKTYGRKNEAWAEIKECVFSQDQMNAILDAFNAIPFDSSEMSSVTQEQMTTITNSIPSTLTKNAFYRVEYDVMDMNSYPEGGLQNPIISGYLTLNEDGGIMFLCDLTYNNLFYTLSGIPTTQGLFIAIEPDLSFSFRSCVLPLIIDGGGTKFLSDRGEYLTPPNATESTAGYMSADDKKRLDNAVVFKDVTAVTSLTNLSIDNYSIKVTLSSASALSFSSTPAEGWECMIDIKNSSTSDIAQPLPNASGWQCDDTSMTIAAGKIASISVRYVHGTYVVIAKGN